MVSHLAIIVKELMHQKWNFFSRCCLNQPKWSLWNFWPVYHSSLCALVCVQCWSWKVRSCLWCIASGPRTGSGCGWEPAASAFRILTLTKWNTLCAPTALLSESSVALIGQKLTFHLQHLPSVIKSETLVLSAFVAVLLRDFLEPATINTLISSSNFLNVKRGIYILFGNV